MKRPLTLYLMRHGESETNVSHVFSGRSVDPALTEEGRKQARRGAEALRDVPLTAIYTSPLARAAQTAAIVGRAIGLEPGGSPDLEEADLGTIEGTSWDVPGNLQVFRGVLDRWQRRELEAGFFEGETLRDIRERLERFLAGIADADGPVLAVGHQVTFMAAIWLFCDNAGDSMRAWRLGHCRLAAMSRNGAPGFHLERFDT